MFVEVEVVIIFTSRHTIYHQILDIYQEDFSLMNIKISHLGQLHRFGDAIQRITSWSPHTTLEQLVTRPLVVSRPLESVRQRVVVVEEDAVEGSVHTIV